MIKCFPINYISKSLKTFIGPRVYIDASDKALYKKDTWTFKDYSNPLYWYTFNFTEHMFTFETYLRGNTEWTFSSDTTLFYDFFSFVLGLSKETLLTPHKLALNKGITIDNYTFLNQSK
jgi:hypothetical protein